MEDEYNSSLNIYKKWKDKFIFELNNFNGSLEKKIFIRHVRIF